MSNVLTYDPKSFNPRTREGCDQGIVLADCIQQRFNPRTREGCDYLLNCVLFQPNRFNPRTREGCDSACFAPDGSTEVSIHAPVKGATAGVIDQTRYHSFQSTHP